MKDYTLGVMETKFAALIWNNAPIPSGELVKLCEREFEWKKSTTYTMLRRLCERGIFQNTDGVVSILLTRQDFQALQSEQFINETFDGSLPSFLVTFATRAKFSKSEIKALQKIINQQKE
jgi:Predicted transcriptional regulator